MDPRDQRYPGSMDIWSYLARVGVSMRNAGEDFFAEGDKVCAMRTCQYLTQIDKEEFLHRDFPEFPCQVPGCSATFKQLHENETHYNAKHRHFCTQCGKSLPTAHLLDLHLSETHDSYFALLALKRPSYQCLVPTCVKEKFWNPQARKEHCLQVHSFPPDFKFEPKSTNKQTSKGKAKAGSASPESPRKRHTNSHNKKKPRPVSVFVAPMEISEEKIASPPTSASKSKLPVLNRRLSLNSTKDTPTQEAAPSSPKPKREPFSLAKMGQRLSAKSSFDVSTSEMDHDTSPVVVASAPLYRKPSGIPTPRSMKKMNSTSSTATTVSSPDRSLTASPTKSRSTVSMNNNSSSNVVKPSDDFLNGNSASLNGSPYKTRIPVRSPSVKVPRNVCFGHKSSQQRTFDMKHWYQTISRSTAAGKKLDFNSEAFEQDMKMALD